MSGYVNARVDIEIDSDDIMPAITDDIADVVRQTMHEEARTIIDLCHDEISDIARNVMTEDLDIDDEISETVQRELENYEIIFVRK